MGYAELSRSSQGFHLSTLQAADLINIATEADNLLGRSQIEDNMSPFIVASIFLIAAVPDFQT